MPMIIPTVTRMPRMGRSADEIATEYDLELSDIYAALAYYFDHREEIDKAIEDSENWIEELKEKTPSLLKQKFGQEPKNG